MNKKIILFNGPPGCGKDTAVNTALAAIISEMSWVRAKHNKLSLGMKEAVHKLYGLFQSVEAIDKEGLKDKPHSDLLGQTPRRAYIEMFKFLQQLHGDAVLGDLMEQEMRRQTQIDVHLLSDGGRFPEVVPLVEYVGAKNLMVVEISATGCNFSNDIREYIGDKVKAQYPKATVRKVQNVKSDDPLDLELFRGMIKGLTLKFLGA